MNQDKMDGMQIAMKSENAENRFYNHGNRG